MSKALESGKSLIDLVLAKLPESLRGDVQKSFLAPEATEALTLLGDSALARSDYSKQMDDIRLQTEKLKADQAVVTGDFERLQEWYEPRKNLLDKYPTLDAVEAAIKAGGGTPNPNPNPNPAPAVGLTRAEIDALLIERDKGYAGVLGLGIEVGSRHLHMFGEPPDMRGVIDIATKRGISLDAAYSEKYGDRLKAKADEAEAARIKQLVDAGVAERMKQAGPGAFPLRNGSPSVLDIFDSQTDKPANHTVDSAVAEYDRLVALRS